MWRVLWIWERLGQLPALPVVAGAWAATGLAALTLGTALVAGLATAAGVLVILYCFARPRGGWDVLATASIPTCGTLLLHDLLGAPEWVFLLLLPFSLLILRDDDRKARAQAEPRSPQGA